MDRCIQLIKTEGLALLPFLKTLVVYFLIFLPEEEPSWIGALLKVLPILSLILFVYFRNGTSLKPEHAFSRKIFVGLLFSAVGDVCLLWPSWFLHGTVAFGIAQCFYISAYGFHQVNWKLGATMVVYLLFNLIFLAKGVLSHGVATALIVFSYSPLLTTMTWRAVDRLTFSKGGWSWEKISSVVGGLSFMASDSVLAFDKFYMKVPNHQMLIMVTYYSAQFFISLGVLGDKHDTAVKTNKKVHKVQKGKH